jgi:protein gp37
MSTSIEWTQRPGTKGETWNPLRAEHRETGQKGWHCEHVSEGCRNCYAEGMNSWRGTGLDYLPTHRQEGGPVRVFLDERALALPLRWKAPRTIFVCSMTDLYGAWHSNADIDRVFGVMALSPQHTFIVLTKRPERMREYLTDADGKARVGAIAGFGASAARIPGRRDHAPGVMEWPLPNVWLGVSVENQPTANERVPLLLDTPAAVRLVSYEPALGAVEFGKWLAWGGSIICPRCGERHLDEGEWENRLHRTHQCQHCAHEWRTADFHTFGVAEGFHPPLNWIICGGESGPGARPMHPAWARSVRDQCAKAGVSFFFKQWGAWAPHQPVAGGDLAGDVRRGVVEIVHPSGESITEIFKRTGGSTIPGSRYMKRVGKRAAGRLLAGREHNEFPGGRG